MTADKLVQANNFAVRLKADGSEKDLNDLHKVKEECQSILSDLNEKAKGTFALNVLCILCRNLEKVPTWCKKIDNKVLLELAVDFVRLTRGLNKPEQVQTLACVFHIHRYIVRLNSPLPPELILKLSYMPFEVTKDNLLGEYYKTYWSILGDRFAYIEKMKSRLAFAKLLPKLTEDILTVTTIYDPVQFCNNILSFIIKKLHILFSNTCTRDLNGVYLNIFEHISKKDNLKMFKKISDKDAFDLYMKFNECLYVIIENNSKVNFEDCNIDYIVRFMVSILGHNTGIFHCFQTVYSNCFSCVFKNKVTLGYLETILQGLQSSCEAAEELGYLKPMYLSYPYIAQLLRLYIEYNISNSSIINWKDSFDATVQEHCFKIILFIITKLNKTEPVTKCNNCKVNTSLHDGLRLTFVTKQVIITSVNQEMDISHTLPSFFAIVEMQYKILTELRKLGCYNSGTCLQKLQTDIHNTAIALNKAKYYKYSIKLFNIYIKSEIANMKNDAEFKNIARALYNKGISELDCKLYSEAVNSAYLSLVFSGEDGMSTDKQMSLVMEIKAKELKEGESKNRDEQNSLQLMSVLTSCKMLAESNVYGNLKPYFSTLSFCSLLKHEFSKYAKLWPSVVPIAGVWISLNQLLKGDYESWMSVEKKETVLRSMFEVMLQTPAVVRNIHCEHYKAVLTEVLQKLDEEPSSDPETRIVQASLLFLQTEYDIADAMQKYGWKPENPITDPDLMTVTRTLPQEHRALRCALQAVKILTEVLPDLDMVAVSPLLKHSLQLAEVFVQQLLNMKRCVQALQLAHVCCKLAQRLDDTEAYLRSAGVLLQRAARCEDQLEHIAASAISRWTELVRSGRGLETALVFACDLAMHYERCGSTATAARLLRWSQARLLAASGEETPSLELAVGRLLEAEALRVGLRPNTLSRVNAVQRHYVAVTNNEARWCPRRRRALVVRGALCAGAELAVRLSRSLRLWRRARSSAGTSLQIAGALCAATLHAGITDTNHEDAQVKIDNRLKHILGLQPSNEIQPYCQSEETKTEPFTPKQTQIETMLDSDVFKKTQTSPSLPCITIPAFKMPEFLTHQDKCQCYACDTPYSWILALQTCALEASMYYRSGEHTIAKNYFDGAFSAMKLCETKVNLQTNSEHFHKYIIDIVKHEYINEVRNIEFEMLIESGYLQLTLGNYEMLNEKIERLNEIIKETKTNQYAINEFHNLLIAASRLKRVPNKQEEGLEEEFESLKLSPNKDILKTPETKYVLMKNTNKVVRCEELPIKRKVIKLNLDDGEDKEVIKENKRTEFKIPVPVTAKPALEAMTPRPKIIVTPANISTPSSKSTAEFFTPIASTPEQFFTPATSVKTYSRKRNIVVKNLEIEFSTPKAVDNRENKPVRRSRRAPSTRLGKL
ncbi:uncharacterized protein [Battus philenor]|uniref:uncharacterized protein n=1 Tax=Battus philenor TaxID=42288 RepID=UPI0035CF2D01